MRRVISSVCLCTFRNLLVQNLQENALIDVLHMEEAGVVGVDGLLETLKLLCRQTER